MSASLSSLKGLSWMLDEVLFARELARNPVEEPLFEISAWRSGSTQLAHLLEDDPHLAAPCMFQGVLPFLWFWRLVRTVFGPWIAAETVTRFLATKQNPDFLQRHEFNPFRVDTFCVVFLFHQLVAHAVFLGPEAGLGEFSHRGITPSTRRMWEEDFVRLVDGLGRRTLAFQGPGPHGRRRFFLKGHFLAAAPALAARWPDARFVTVTREPAARLRSTLNYLRCSIPDFFGLGPLPWRWIAAMAESELEYNRAEQAWFTQDDGICRCVVPFDAFVRDLPGSLARIYRTCLDADGPPPEVQVSHGPRRSAPYRVDHSLEALGVDVVALDGAMAEYRAWCRGSPADARSKPEREPSPA